MIKAVRVRAYQQMPNYRKPASFLIKESYPLPPFSSVIGLVHNLCGWVGKEAGYRPMKISVQGTSASAVSDYATNYVFGAIPLERAQLIAESEGGKKTGITITPRSYELLTDVELVLHILPEDSSLLEQIAAAFRDPPVYPSLGRYEDLLQITEVDIVELEAAEDTVSAKMDAFLPLASVDSDFSENLTGTVYRLGKIFEYSGKGKQKKRIWKESVTARHICAGVTLAATEDILWDAQREEAVFPA